MISFPVKNINHVWLELTESTMKKSQLFVIVCALTLLAMISAADAAIIASDATSIARMDQSYPQPIGVSPPSLSGVDLTLGAPGDSGQAQHDKYFNYYINDTSSESPRTDSHISLWLLLLVASVFGILSEIFHRISYNR